MAVSDDARAAIGRYPWQGNVGRMLLAVSIMGVMATFVVGIVRSALESRWYGTAKAVRDAAEAGSDLLAWQGAIHTLESWNLPLTFVFMATGLIGIAFLLWGIVTTIQRRGNVSAHVFPVLREHSH